VNAEVRFNKKVRRTKKCWLWKGSTRRGYGLFWYLGRSVSAHRFAYQAWVGPLGPDDVVHHKCGNSRCVRPTHLQRVSSQENLAEMFERNNYQRVIRKLEAEVKRLRKQLEELS
jgi:hypothetical protein